MIGSPAAWHWELTPLEVFEGYWLCSPPNPGGRIVRERAGLNHVPAESLAGTPYTMQWGVSSRSLCPDMAKMRAFAPSMQDPHKAPGSRERRSGILVFSEGPAAIAGYIVDGFSTAPQHKLWVDAAHQGEGLGERMLLEWYKRVPRVTSAEQTMNLRGAAAFLGVRERLYRWAAEEGLPVPGKVLREMTTGAEAAIIREKIEQVRRTGERARI